AAPALAVGPAPTAAIVDAPAPALLPAAVRGEFEGFGAVAAPSHTPSQPGVSVTYVVKPGDTIWGIVEQHYGRADATLVRQVASASQIEDPNLIQPGWIVTLPDAELSTVPSVRGEATWGAVTVVPGDTLWDIVELHYGEANADFVWAVMDANPTIDDPGLILPGQIITLPPTPTPASDAEAATPAPPVASPSVTAAPRQDAPTPAPPVEAPSVTAAPTAEAELTVPSTDPEVGDSTLPEGTEAVPSTSSTLRPGALQSGAGTTAVRPASSWDLNAETVEEGEQRSPSMAAIIGWTGGAGLAAALLGLAARRRRRLPVRARHARPPDRAVQLGIALHETENLPLVELAANALRALAARVRPRPGEPTPVPRLLRLGSDAVELVWDAPSPDVIEPWTSGDGGWSWNLDSSAALPRSDGPAPCPGFVTIGTQADADVLLNLESCGSVAITGDQDAAEALARAVATEFAASAFADSPTLVLVGVSDLAANPDHAIHGDVASAVGWLRDRSESAGALLAHRRLTSLFALRARSQPNDAHESVVVLVDAAAVVEGDVTQLVELANGDLGAVVVLIGDHPSVTWRLECSGYDVTIEPLGLTVDAVALPESIDPLVDDFVPERDPTLDDLDEDDMGPSQLALLDHLDVIALRDRTQVGASEAASDSTGERPEAELGDWDVELKVLGQVGCVGTDEPLTPQELHMAVLLAFNRGGLNSDTIITWIWPKGCVMNTLTNAMSDLRRKLGLGGDGEPLFPKGRDNGHVYRLSPRVVTDWERFVALVRRAESLPDADAVPMLDEALGLVSGPPFQAKKGYSWAYSDGTATLIAETIRVAARRSAELHLAQGEMIDAATAAAAALAAIGAPPIDLDQLI
ncbi:MAG: LysM peptidoglycan-binding domain-containing protein, partial [Acidimicrobiia bacterium]